MNYYYRNGDIPILILSLHGGNQKVKCSPRKPNKSVKNFVKDNDNYPIKTSFEVVEHLTSFTDFLKEQIKEVDFFYLY